VGHCDKGSIVVVFDTKNNIFVKFILQLTEPILSPIRSLLENTSFGKNSTVDFSPVIALLILWVVSGFIDIMI